MQLKKDKKMACDSKFFKDLKFSHGKVVCAYLVIVHYDFLKLWIREFIDHRFYNFFGCITQP